MDRQRLVPAMSGQLRANSYYHNRRLVRRLLHKIGGDAKSVWKATYNLLALLEAKGDSIEHRNVAVFYGGGKDSTYILIFVRLVQLLIASLRNGNTFHLISVTNRHAGMPPAVIENISRAYTRLRLVDDQRATLLLVDGEIIHPFSDSLTLPAPVRERDRRDLLMSAHQCYAAARPSFCNFCNLSMVASFGVAVRRLRADVLVTGDSQSERLAYGVWTRQASREFSLPRPGAYILNVIDAIGRVGSVLSEHIHGESTTTETEGNKITDPIFFAIYGDRANYAVGDHRDALDYVGFQFGDGLHGSESDCKNPALMAHLRGLLAEQVRGTGYERGVDEYLILWRELMLLKQFSNDLIDKVIQRYATQAARQAQRRDAEQFAMCAFGLTTANLVAMVFSPFASRCKNLLSYLQAAAPDLLSLAENIRLVLGGTLALGKDPALADAFTRLNDLTGLTLSQMTILYSRPLVEPLLRRVGDVGFRRESGDGTAIALLLQRDPHQVIVRTKLTPGGEEVEEKISGR